MGRKKLYITENEAIAAKKKQDRIRYLKNKKEILKKYKENGGNEKSLEYYHKNKEILKIKKRKYYLKNKADYAKYGKEYRLEKKTEIALRKNGYQKKKRLEDKLFKLRGDISSLIRVSIKNKGYSKSSRTQEILGCSFEEFKTYLESKFESWMTWDNKGNPKDGILEPNKTWDIDHIIPMVTAMSEEDVIKLNHYTNLQPLCSYVNRFVKDKLIISK